MQGLLCHGVGLSPKTERPCLLAVALTGSIIPLTEPAQQAQSHCCATAQQSHLSIRSNLTAAHAAISLRPARGEPKNIVPGGLQSPKNTAGSRPPHLTAPHGGEIA